MNSLVSWQLLLFLCATHFGEPLEKVASVENSRPTGQQLESLDLSALWEQSLPCTERKPAATARLSRRGASLSSPAESSGSPQRRPVRPSSRQIPAPQGGAGAAGEGPAELQLELLRPALRQAGGGTPGSQGRGAGRG
uniref:KiSS-1 metastasis suppressor n=1 Tax=Macaca fascicularis TaxID=9541 RepID=A0A2K5WT72_MACFA